MGNLIITEYVSLDGVTQAPAGGEEFEHAGWTITIDRGPEGDEFKLDETRRSAALLFGRVTYEGMAAAWPQMTGEFADKVEQHAQVRRELHANDRRLAQHGGAAGRSDREETGSFGRRT